MTSSTQKDQAAHFRALHHGTAPLLIGNAWDATSAVILERAGFQAIATTSSGVAAAFGYPDGERISRDMLIELVARMARVVTCPLSVDLEAGYGASIDAVLQTVRAIIEAGAVGLNIEDSAKQPARSLVDIASQVALLKAIRELGQSMDVPLVINARTDVYLLGAGDAESRFDEALRRAQAYREAGADCFFPILLNDAQTIAKLAQAVQMPMNILASPATPTIGELARIGVARVSFGGGLMRATLGHLRNVAHELLEQGSYSGLSTALASAEFGKLFTA